MTVTRQIVTPAQSQESSKGKTAMGNAVRRDVEPVLPGVEDVAQAQEAARALAKFVAEAPKAQLSIEDSARRMHAALPPAAVHLLKEILRNQRAAAGLIRFQID